MAGFLDSPILVLPTYFLFLLWLFGTIQVWLWNERHFDYRDNGVSGLSSTWPDDLCRTLESVLVLKKPKKAYNSTLLENFTDVILDISPCDLVLLCISSCYYFCPAQCSSLRKSGMVVSVSGCFNQIYFSAENRKLDVLEGRICC